MPQAFVVANISVFAYGGEAMPRPENMGVLYSLA
jgi:hypothetical protein